MAGPGYPDFPEDERGARLAGERALADADAALDRDDAAEARSTYLLAAAHFRRAARLADRSRDEGARRADEAAAIAALHAAEPLAE